MRPHTRVFDRIVVTPNVRGGTTVAYGLDTVRFRESGPYTFFLEWAEVPDGEFIEIDGPEYGAVLVDDYQRRFTKSPHSAYRIRLETPDNIYYSDPDQLLGTWNRHLYLTVKDVIRREYLRMTRYTGTRGLYVPRKQWGVLCPRCRDYNTDMTTDAKCVVCFGTRFVGGYYAPVSLWMDEDRTPTRARREDGVGVVADQTQTARAVACPFLNAKDLWFNVTTGERWIVQSTHEIVSVQGKPVVYAVELRLAHPASIIYDLPLTPEQDQTVVEVNTTGA